MRRMILFERESTVELYTCIALDHHIEMVTVDVPISVDLAILNGDRATQLSLLNGLFR